jgi:hypothetical protein
VLCAVILHLMTQAEQLRNIDVVAGLTAPVALVLIVPHSLVAVVVAYVALLASWGYASSQGDSIPRRVWLVAVGPLFAFGAYQAWSWTIGARTSEYVAGIDPTQEMNLADPRGDSLWQALIAQWWHFWPGAVSGDSLGFGNWELLISTGGVLLLAGGVGIALLTDTADRRARFLAVGLLVGAPLTALVFERIFAFAVPARYGSSVLGIGFMILALTVARGPGRALLGLSSLLWLTALFSQWP